MPAWGRTHDDAKIWDIVAFVRLLPRMSAAQYRALTAAARVDEHETDH
jgi:mono/diheme cytochrome c family protein